jgi:hypothetical protein
MVQMDDEGSGVKALLKALSRRETGRVRHHTVYMPLSNLHNLCKVTNGSSLTRVLIICMQDVDMAASKVAANVCGCGAAGQVRHNPPPAIIRGTARQDKGMTPAFVMQIVED